MAGVIIPNRGDIHKALTGFTTEAFSELLRHQVVLDSEESPAESEQQQELTHEQRFDFIINNLRALNFLASLPTSLNEQMIEDTQLSPLLKAVRKPLDGALRGFAASLDDLNGLLNSHLGANISQILAQHSTSTHQNMTEEGARNLFNVLQSWLKENGAKASAVMKAAKEVSQKATSIDTCLAHATDLIALISSEQFQANIPYRDDQNLIDSRTAAFINDSLTRYLSIAGHAASDEAQSDFSTKLNWYRSHLESIAAAFAPIIEVRNQLTAEWNDKISTRGAVPPARRIVQQVIDNFRFRHVLALITSSDKPISEIYDSARLRLEFDQELGAVIELLKQRSQKLTEIAEALQNRDTPPNIDNLTRAIRSQKTDLNVNAPLDRILEVLRN